MIDLSKVTKRSLVKTGRGRRSACALMTYRLFPSSPPPHRLLWSIVDQVHVDSYEADRLHREEGIPYGMFHGNPVTEAEAGELMKDERAGEVDWRPTETIPEDYHAY